MAKVINLRMARKARRRAEAESTAQANRAKFGQTKAERQRNCSEAERTARLLDGAQRRPED